MSGPFFENLTTLLPLIVNGLEAEFRFSFGRVCVFFLYLLSVFKIRFTVELIPRVAPIVICERIEARGKMDVD